MHHIIADRIIRLVVKMGQEIELISSEWDEELDYEFNHQFKLGMGSTIHLTGAWTPGQNATYVLVESPFVSVPVESLRSNNVRVLELGSGHGERWDPEAIHLPWYNSPIIAREHILSLKTKTPTRRFEEEFVCNFDGEADPNIDILPGNFG